MSTWSEILRIYRQPRLLAVLFMGFSSGLPLPLTASTLQYRLAESGVSLTAIGLFIFAGLSYSLKVFWAPFIDRLSLPWPLGTLGRRRGWAILIQCLLSVAIVTFGLVDPARDPYIVAFLAVVVAFLSASQDIVIDAYRIELLPAEEQAAGVVATQYGYRFGLMAAGAGAFYLAEYGSWAIAYAAMAALMPIGMITVLLTPEPALKTAHGKSAGSGIWGVFRWIQETVAAPFREFVQRPGWAVVLAFVMLYKFGDALANAMAYAFYFKLGFTKIEVADISKIFGSVVTLVGFVAGAAVVHRLGLYRSMLVCGVLQMLSNLLYAVQAVFGHDTRMLAITIGVENFTSAMGSVAFIAYLSSLCNVAFTGTQYALLSSIATIGRTSLSASGGFLAERFGWVTFFVLTTFAALPGLVLLVFLIRRFRGEKHAVAV